MKRAVASFATQVTPIAAAAALCALGLAGGARAQTAQGGPSTQAATDSQSITVTATRRREPIRDVPLSVSALNPDSLRVAANALVEPALLAARPGEGFQFTRLGYFACDPDSTAEKLVFNRTVTLKDAWAKLAK